MKSFRLLCLHITLAFALVACNNAAENKAETKDSTSVVTETKSVDSVALKMAGTYSGYIPCADCAGIMTYLILNPDMSYRLEETYAGKNDTAFRTSGSWKREKNKVVLDDKGSVKASYQSETDKLIQLDIEGNRITGNLGDKYVLVKSAAAMSNNAAWNEKKAAGVDFIGLGNEPFWSVEFDKGNSVSFNTPDRKTPLKLPWADPITTNGISEYHIQTESHKMDVSIFPQLCSDGMSDNLYEFKVVLKLNNKKYQGCGVMLGSL